MINVNHLSNSEIKKDYSTLNNAALESSNSSPLTFRDFSSQMFQLTKALKNLLLDGKSPSVSIEASTVFENFLSTFHQVQSALNELRDAICDVDPIAHKIRNTLQLASKRIYWLAQDLESHDLKEKFLQHTSPELLKTAALQLQCFAEVTNNLAQNLPENIKVDNAMSLKARSFDFAVEDLHARLKSK